VSTTGRAILQLYKPTAGKVEFLGKNLTTLGGGELRKMRREMQMIFQDPYASLNPRMTVGSIIGEPLEIHNLAKGREKQERVQELLRIVGLNPYFANRIRTSFRARPASHTALTLAVQPSSSCATSHLGPTSRFKPRSSTCSKSCRATLTYLFIAHDLSVVRHI
jgi:oligopeptide transport system ATP-binding protein